MGFEKGGAQETLHSARQHNTKQQVKTSHLRVPAEIMNVLRSVNPTAAHQPSAIVIESFLLEQAITRSNSVSPCFDLSYLGLVPRPPKHQLEMGFVNKASKLLEGVRRHKHDLQSHQESLEQNLNDQPKGRITRFVAAQRLRRRRMATVQVTMDAPLRNTIKETMAQTIAYTHDNEACHTEYSQVTRDTADNHRVHIVEDEEENEEDLSDDYEDSESEDEVDESVIEDMRKLEESFRGISRKYRLINRIGEGEI